jgi:Tfp pilus assembly protein PilN
MSRNDIYYDCGLGLSEDETGKLTVYLAMVKKETISKLLLDFEGLGVLIDGVSSSSSLCKSLKFRFLNLRNKNKTRTQKLERGLVLGGISLFCFCGILYWTNLNQRVEFLSLKMGEYSVKAREVGSLRDKIITQNRNEKLYYTRLERIRLEKILEAITTSLPADSWIFEFNHSGSKITISGQSKDTTIVLKNLDDQPLFTNVSNSSTSISTVSGQAVERFMISFDFMQPDFLIQSNLLTQGDKDE